MSQAEAFIEKFYVPEDNGTLTRLMYYRAIVAIGDCVKHGECWVYPKVNGDGYGMLKIAGKVVTASRLILCCATHQALTFGMDACHRSPICRFRSCCNPEHLYWDTRENKCRKRESEKRAKEAAKLLVGQMTDAAEALST